MNEFSFPARGSLYLISSISVFQLVDRWHWNSYPRARPSHLGVSRQYMVSVQIHGLEFDRFFPAPKLGVLGKPTSIQTKGRLSPLDLPFPSSPIMHPEDHNLPQRRLEQLHSTTQKRRQSLTPSQHTLIPSKLPFSILIQSTSSLRRHSMHSHFLPRSLQLFRSLRRGEGGALIQVGVHFTTLAWSACQASRVRRAQ